MGKQSAISSRATAKKRTSTQATRSRRATAAAKQLVGKLSLGRRIKAWWCRLRQRRRDLLRRRPHRSFRRTARRDYRRSLAVPGYWALTAQTVALLRRHKWLFFKVALLYAIGMVVIAQLMAEDTYVQLREVVTAVQEEGLLGGATATLLVFWGVLIGQVSGGGPTDTSTQVVAGLIGLFVWLTTIWLVRAVLAGNAPKLRDGLYNAGGPVLALVVLAIIGLLQLLPAAIAVLVYSAADASGVLAWTPVLMLAGGAVALIVVLSIYWMTATGFAMVIATLPGIYPLEAMKLAGDVVIGRRVRILLRMVWLIALLIVVWAAVLVPVILLDGIIKSWWPAVGAVPFVPLAALVMAAVSVVVLAVYIYLFYRKVVEDDSAPA